MNNEHGNYGGKWGVVDQERKVAGSNTWTGKIYKKKGRKERVRFNGEIEIFGGHSC